MSMNLQKSNPNKTSKAKTNNNIKNVKLRILS